VSDMGQQVRFFMDSGDEKRFVEFLRGTGDVIILPYHSPTKNPIGLKNLPNPSSDDFPYHVWLFNRSVSSNLVMEYIPTLNCYMVDQSVSSVVEFSRTVQRENMMRPGRLWAEFKYLDSKGNWAFKEDEFKKWYESLVKWIRKNHSREIDPDFYSGPGAVELIKKNRLEIRFS